MFGLFGARNGLDRSIQDANLIMAAITIYKFWTNPSESMAMFGLHMASHILNIYAVSDCRSDHAAVIAELMNLECLRILKGAGQTNFDTLVHIVSTVEITNSLVYGPEEAPQRGPGPG